MKNFFLFFIIVFSLSSCTNKENEYAEILKQNNTFLSDQIETYKVKLGIKKMEIPRHYDSLYYKAIYKIVDNTYALKNYENYNNISKIIIELIKNKNLNLKFSSIKSENVEILKNNLFMHIIKIYNMYEFNNTLAFSHCSWGNRLMYTKSIENDSIELNIETFNPYHVVIDSILDNKKKIIDFKSNTERSIWKVKYKSNSKNTKIFGKIYSVDDVFLKDPILLQKLE